MMNRKQLSLNSLLLPLPSGRAAPHFFLFLFFNLAYFLPLLGGMLFNYSEGGTGKAADLSSDVARKITSVYLLGTLAFWCGSKVSSFRGLLTSYSIEQRALRLFVLTGPFRMVCLATIGLFALSKVFLVRLGVYSEYAFTTNSMTGGMWSFSMFCSESLLLLSMVVLFSNARRNVLWFLVLTGINGINLLHGTRIFFMIGAIAFCFYLYVHRRLTFKIAIFALSGSVILGYLIFLFRSRIEVDDQAFSFTRVISPIMYEGIFSQLSLIGTITHPEAWNWSGSPLRLFLDTLYFTTPRFLLPGKDELLFTDQFADLSPLGAFSGYAQGLIYFGIFFPLFYFALGMISGWLQRHARHSQFWSVIYVYFVCDFLFRIMRDGYAMPIKMMLNALVIMLVVGCLQHPLLRFGLVPDLPRHLKNSPGVGGN